MQDSQKIIDWAAEIRKAKLEKLDVRKKEFEAAKRKRKLETK